MADYKDQSADPGVQLKNYSFNPMDETGVSMKAASDAFVNDTDLATWDSATVCGSCHIGGSIVEFDRNGLRHSQRPMDTAGFNVDQNYVLELYDPTTGLPTHYLNPMTPAGTPQIDGVTTGPGFGVAYAMWAMPGTSDNKFNKEDLSNVVYAPNAFIQSQMMDPDGEGPMPEMETNPYIASGMAVAGQMLMPNVREMDCFFCHLSGFNNIISSVATQMGYLNAAPALSSGLMNMFSQTYMPGTVVANGDPMEGMGQPVKLSASFLSRLNGEPKQENCRQCHTPTTMKNFSDMFDKFLAAAPMDFDPTAPGASLINGLVMPKYDLNSPLMGTGTSPQVFFNFSTYAFEYGDGSSAAGPFGMFPMAMNASWSMLAGPDDPASSPLALAGGGQAAMTGPLFYAGAATNDQNANKKSIIPFPRADFFKRGDIWDNDTQEVHYAFGCGGCHFNAGTFNEDLNQCDPGRGRSRMSGIESGQLQNGGTTAYGEVIPTTTGIDTHDTVKRCQDCHLTGKNFGGQDIETFGAPNPTGKHADAGLLANITNARGLDAAGDEIDFVGNHLDVMDCTICHIYKKSMTVRSLDSTSGNRYPAMIGFPFNKGMMGMFTDPMDADNLSDTDAYNAFSGNMSAMGYTQAAIDGMLAQYAAMYGVTTFDIARMQLKNPPEEWQPLYTWYDGLKKTLPNGDVNPDWRRKIVAINFIVAQMWDDAHGLADATEALDNNGDNAETNILITDKSAIEWDPPIARDMKAGMNFAAGPFGTIPVGFGGGAYASAFNPDFSFSGAFEFVGTYGGNVVLTTPEEIAAYKANRWANFDADVPGQNRDYRNMKLLFVGGNPFQVTHNVVDTSIFAKGKKVGDAYGCDDCHGPSVRDPQTGNLLKGEFFSGGYDMTGAAIPASATYDVDGAGEMATAVASNMFFRPVVDYEVMALKDDLNTSSEAKSKLNGATVDVEFDVCLESDKSTVIDCEDALAVYRQTHDLGRDRFLYPDEDEAALAAKILALESITPEAYGIGVVPTVDTELSGVGVVTGVTQSDGVSTYTEVNADAAVTVGVTPTAGFTYFSYYQNIADASDTGVTVTGGVAFTFPAAGTYRVVTSATSSEGKITNTVEYVVVKPALVNGFVTPVVPVVGASGITVTLALDTDPGTHNSTLVNWADGTAQNFYEGAEPLMNVYPLAMAGQTVRVNAAFYQDGVFVATWAIDIQL